MAIYTLKNRWKEPFRGMWDGQVYEVIDTLACIDYIAASLKKQSIIRDNPITGDNDYRLAILELGDDTSPIEELPKESLDRTDMEDFRKVVYKSTGLKVSTPAQRQAARFDDSVRTTE